jgi:hypothetical protein
VTTTLKNMWNFCMLTSIIWRIWMKINLLIKIRINLLKIKHWVWWQPIYPRCKISMKWGNLFSTLLIHLQLWLNPNSLRQLRACWMFSKSLISILNSKKRFKSSIFIITSLKDRTTKLHLRSYLICKLRESLMKFPST